MILSRHNSVTVFCAACAGVSLSLFSVLIELHQCHYTVTFAICQLHEGRIIAEVGSWIFGEKPSRVVEAGDKYQLKIEFKT